jgi:hypothetical protein
VAPTKEIDMVTKSEPAQASARPAKAGKKDAVEKLNAQVLRTAEWAEGLKKDMAWALSAPEMAASSKVSLRVALTATLGDVERLLDTARLVSQGLHRLHKEKWNPRGGGKYVVAIGDLVAVRKHEFKRFAGAWENADLASLSVVSLHGNKAKCRIQRDGLAGEVVGLVPVRWLQIRAA